MTRDPRPTPQSPTELDLLLAWYVADPSGGLDHLADRDPGMRLEIPGYVLWAENGFGGLALADERTGGMHDSSTMPALAIFRSVAEQGSLEGAEASEARRLGSTPGRPAATST